MRTTSPAIELHGVPFRVLLAYSTNAVFVVRLDAELPLEYAECAARHRAIVEAEASRRNGLTRGPYWHRFYQEPGAPSGVMENGEFVPAPSFSARGEFVIISEQNAPIVGISTYLAPDYGQAFFASGSRDIQINAASFARQGAPVCEIALQMSLSGVNGEFVSSGPEGAQHLAERLAAAEFVRSVTDLVTPDPMDAPRLFPSLAMRDRVERGRLL